MRTVRILHLYSMTLNLYGDYKNIDALCQRIRETGNEVRVDTAEYGEPIDTAGYDMVYIGHGTNRAMEGVADHFLQYGSSIKEQIEAGQIFLVTGNAQELFGERFNTPSGAIKRGIGLFDYTAEDDSKVYVSDMVGRPVFDSETQVYGFLNCTAELVGENQYPLFRVEYGAGNSRKPGGTEGTLYKNFFGTWCMGPLLCRNPGMMREFLKRLLKEDYRACDFKLETAALNKVLLEFKTKTSAG